MSIINIILVHFRKWNHASQMIWKHHRSEMIAVTAQLIPCKNAVNFITLWMSVMNTLYKRGGEAVATYNAAWSSWVRTDIAVHVTFKSMAFAKLCLCMLMDLMWCCTSCDCLALAIKWFSHCALIRTPLDSTCFVHAQSVLWLGIPGVPRAFIGDTTTLLLHCLCSHCDNLGVLHFSWKPSWCDRGLSSFYFNESN